MSKCEYFDCKNEVTQTQGRRPRKFCSDSCRQKDYVKKKKLKPTIEEGKVYSVKDGKLHLFTFKTESEYDDNHKSEILEGDGIKWKWSSNKELGTVYYENGKIYPIDHAVSQSYLKQKLAEIKAEKCPTHRDTPIGRKSWDIEQQNKIKEFQKHLITN